MLAAKAVDVECHDVTGVQVRFRSRLPGSTPAGVPVFTRSPGRSAMSWLEVRINSVTPKIVA